MCDCESQLSMAVNNFDNGRDKTTVHDEPVGFSKAFDKVSVRIATIITARAMFYNICGYLNLSLVCWHIQYRLIKFLPLIYLKIALSYYQAQGCALRASAFNLVWAFISYGHISDTIPLLLCQCCRWGHLSNLMTSISKFEKLFSFMCKMSIKSFIITSMFVRP